MSLDTHTDINNNHQKNKRIASNTIVLFLRMFILMIINLYTVRLVLNRLGEMDYGVYNAVASAVTASAFISSVLALSIQRFYSYALGLHDYKKLNIIFSASINIIIGAVIVLVLILETVGVWFISTRMSIPHDRLLPAIILFQFALSTLILSISQIPFTAAVFAHEDMGVYAIISTIEWVGRLIVALLIGVFAIDNLIFYGLGLFANAIIVACSYIIYSKKHYEECHYKWVKSKKIYKQLLSFSGWTTFGSISNTLIIQGSTIIINIFFGPLLNVAFGIALNINNAFMTLTSTMVIPFRPQMIKAYAEKNYNYVNRLFSVSNKFIFYVLLAVALPIICEMDTILGLWLGKYSPDTLLFSRLIIIYIVCMSLHNPITTIIHASGHIKEYHLLTESITLLCLPITCLIFYLGYPSYYIFYVMIGLCISAHIARLYCLNKFYEEFSITDYFTRFLFPALIVTLIGSSITLLCYISIANLYIQLFIIGIVSPITLLLLAFLIGINNNERTTIKSYINKIIKRR